MRVIITDAGYDALTNAANDGTNAVRITQVALGSGDAPPAPERTALEAEHRRLATIAGEAVSENTLHVTIRDESDAAYTVREFGLILDDGTLFGIYAQTDPIIEKAGGSTLLLSVDAIFTDVDATMITFGDVSFSNPPASETVKGVAERANRVEAEAGSDNVRFMSPLRVFQAIAKWLGATGPGAGKGLDADLVDGQHASAFATSAQGVRADTALQRAKNLLDLANKATARSNLGLGSAATKNAGAGNGLDADTVDGEHAAQMHDARRLTDTVPVARLSGSYNISITGRAATAGDAQTVNALGLGAIAVSSELDANNYTNPGFYLTPRAGLINFPPGVGSRCFITVAGEPSSYIAQTLHCTGDNTMFERSASGPSLADAPWIRSDNGGLGSAATHAEGDFLRPTPADGKRHSGNWLVTGQNESGTINALETQGGIGADSVERSGFYKAASNSPAALLAHVAHPDTPGYAWQIGVRDYASPSVVSRTQNDGVWGAPVTMWHDGNLGAATTAKRGIVERATNAEADGGTDTTRYVTPAQLNDTYLGSRGYTRLPGGFIMQWFTISVPGSGTARGYFRKSMNQVYNVQATMHGAIGGSQSEGVFVVQYGNSYADIQNFDSEKTHDVHVFAVGWET